MKKFTTILSLLLSLSIVFMSCEGDQGEPGINGQDGADGMNGQDGTDGMDLVNVEVDIDTIQFTSITPALVEAVDLAGVTITPLLSTEDTLGLSPGYTFGGSADGSGLVANGDGSFSLFINQEDNYAVSKVTFNASMTPVKGEYVLNSSGSGTRLCSGSMAYPDIHGFGPLFLAAGESGRESFIKAVDVATASSESAGIPRPLPSLGRWNAENAVPLPVDAVDKLSGRSGTAIVIGDDDGDGHLGLYYDTGAGDLVNGSVWFLKRADNDQVEVNITEGQTVAVEFAQIPDVQSLSGNQINEFIKDNGGLKFGRIEDVDYRKGSDLSVGTEVWFAVTGSNRDAEVTRNGRIYKLEFGDDEDLTTAELTLVIDGDADGNGSLFHNPDNITVTENFVYVQEDPNGYNRGDASDQGAINGGTHPAYIYQHNIATGETIVAFQANRIAPYNTEEDGDLAVDGDWEYGSLIDITDIIGASESTFILAVQTHSWRRPEFAGLDGGAIRPNENQGSQIVLLTGLPR